MPKIKSHSGCKKRFRKNAAGKVKRAAAGRRHHAWARSANGTLSLRGIKYISKADIAKLKVLMPN